MSVRPKQGTLSPNESDVALARRLVETIIRAGEGRTRLIALIGSRSLGTATASSDLDLVVIVERVAGTPQWNGPAAELVAERIRRALPRVSVSVDLSVRSGEQYQEARAVFGGVEQLLDREGTVLFSQPFEHPPFPRRTKSAVRRALTRAWIEASCRSITSGFAANHRALHHITGDKLGIRVSGVEAPIAQLLEGSGSVYEGSAILRATQQATAALCVAHQVESSKHESVLAIASRLRTAGVSAGAGLESLVSRPLDLSSAVGALELALIDATVDSSRDRELAAVGRRIADWKHHIASVGK